MGKRRQICFQLDEEIIKRIKKLSAETGLSISNIINIYTNGFVITKKEGNGSKVIDILGDDKEEKNNVGYG